MFASCFMRVLGCRRVISCVDVGEDDVGDLGSGQMLFDEVCWELLF